MRSFCIVFLVLISVSYVLSQTVTLEQPGSTVVKPSQTLKTTCKVSVSVTIHTWHWARQKTGSGLEYIGYITGSGGINYASTFQGKVTFTRETSKNELYFEMSNMRNEDSGIYYCVKQDAVTGAFDYWGPGTLVTVTTASEQAPSLFPLITCDQSTNPMILGCLARDFFPETIDFGWKDESNASIASGFKNFRPVSQTGPGDKVTTFASSQLTVANANWEQRKIFYCQATHESKTKTVRLQKREVIILPPTVSINPPLRDSTTYNGTATIVCVISGFSPNNIQVRWLKNFNQTIESTTDEPVADKNGGFKTISAITIPWIELDRGYEFSCEVKHEASNFYELKNVSGSQGCDMPSSGIQVTTIPPTFESIFTEKKAKLTCKVSHMSSTDGLSISWYQKGKSEDLQTKLEDGIYSNGITVIGIAEVCVDDWQKDRFECKVKHPDLAALKVVALFKQNGGFTSSPEVYIYPPHQDELAQGETATLACLVKGFSPNDAFVKWTHMGEPLDPSVYINTEPIKELSATGKSTYFMYSKLNIEPKNWTDGKSYTCVVGHETLPLQLVQKTIDKYTGKAHAVNVSLVMSDTC